MRVFEDQDRGPGPKGDGAGDGGRLFTKLSTKLSTNRSRAVPTLRPNA